MFSGILFLVMGIIFTVTTADSSTDFWCAGSITTFGFVMLMEPIIEWRVNRKYGIK